MKILVVARALMLAALACPALLGAQHPDSVPSGRARTEVGADRADSASLENADPYYMVDTIVVLEDVKGLTWGDWYVSPGVRSEIQRAIEREGQLSGRAWLESGAPIRDLALEAPRGAWQALNFVDKGVSLSFWEPGEVDYRYDFEGPRGVRASGIAAPDAPPAVAGGSRGTGGEGRMRITLPLATGFDGSSAEPSQRVARLDVSYRPRSRAAAIPRGRFTIFFYYANPRLGYRIAGVGY